MLERFSAAPKRVAILTALALAVGMAFSALSGAGVNGSRGLAAPASPPPPPTFIPTPIGPPPGAPGGTSTPMATGTASATVTPQASPTTVTIQREISFTLQAARVSKRGNPGNLRGLASVRPGSTVWLMMYYSVTNLPHAAMRVTTYSILRNHQPVFTVAYRGNMSPAEAGKRLSRYTVYSVPRTLPLGQYAFRAVLKIGARQQTKTWRFSLGTKQREVGSASAQTPSRNVALALKG